MLSCFYGVFNLGLEAVQFDGRDKTIGDGQSRKNKQTGRQNMSFAAK